MFCEQEKMSSERFRVSESEPELAQVMNIFTVLPWVGVKLVPLIYVLPQESELKLMIASN